jgi:hypothetical protein
MTRLTSGGKTFPETERSPAGIDNAATVDSAVVNAVSRTVTEPIRLRDRGFRPTA